MRVTRHRRGALSKKSRTFPRDTVDCGKKASVRNMRLFIFLQGSWVQTEWRHNPRKEERSPPQSALVSTGVGP